MEKCRNCHASLPNKKTAAERMKNTGKSHIVCPCGNTYILSDLETEEPPG